MSTDKRGVRWFFVALLTVVAAIAACLGIARAYAEPSGTSTDLREFTASVDVKGADYDEQNESFSVRPGSKLSFSFGFAESSDKQFDREHPLTYTLPSGFDYGDQSGTFPLRIDNAGSQASLNVSYTIKEGVLTVAWPQDDQNYKLFKETSNAKFSITFDAIYTNADGSVDFGNGVTKTFKLDSSHDVGVKKDGYVGQDGKIHYSVTVTSTGHNDNVHVTDAISGTALTYDADSFAISGNSSTPERGTSGNGFDITLPSMGNGEVATITYTASIDYSKITDGGTAEQTGNNVSVNTPDQSTPKTDSKNFEHQIQTSNIIYKSGTAAAQSDGTGHREVTWTIDANPKHLFSLAGRKISDAIDVGSQDFMRYSGSGIRVEVFDENGALKETRKVGWSDLGTDPSSASGWSYLVPGNDGNYEYRISYSTSVDMQGQVQSKNVKNNASISNGPSTSGNVDVPSDFNFDVHKSVLSHDAETASWQITATVPKDGYSSFEMTDTLPTTYLNGKNIYDQFVDGSIQVDGLQTGESYTVDSSDPTKVVLEFFRDQGHATRGLGASASDRTITVTLNTRFNADWLAAVNGGTAADWQKMHTNKVSVVANNVEKESEATVTPVAQSLKKTGAQFGTVNVNGVSLPVYRYELVLTGVSNADLDIDDSFDKHLAYCSNPGQWDANLIFGGNQYSQDNKGLISPTFTVNGNSMRIHVPKDALSKDESGSTYSHYKIVYYLMVKDDNALSDLDRSAASHGGKVALSNTAAWGADQSTATIDYDYAMLDKQLSKKPTSDDRKASYKLELNPKALDINPNGDTAMLKDKMINQDLDITSVKVQVKDGEPLSDNQYHYDYDLATGELTLTFPDDLALKLTYDTIVTGTGNVTYSNTATLQGQSKETSAEVQLSHGGSGTASILGIKLLKHAEGDLKEPLPGAQFELYKAPSSGDDSFENSAHVTGKDGNVVLASDSEGVVQVRGVRSTDGWTLDSDRTYYLVEIKAPDGYQLDATPIKFAVSDAPKGTDTFVNGYEMEFSNKKKQDLPEGTQLPVFGGPGDTMFYIIGGVLAAAGGASLLLCRRFWA